MSALAIPADLARLKGRHKESDLYGPIIQAFAARGIYLERRNAGMMLLESKGKRRAIKVGTLGTPDLMGWDERGRVLRDGVDAPWKIVTRGVVVAVEVKRPGHRPAVSGRTMLREHAQQAYLERIRRAGGLAWTVTSVDDVARILA